ncbi:2Fe-2S iron-sulfur cluster-binding protein [Pelistega europaea]|uniref:2Fe-2S iron-sulfur cluster binding domain-containing protein n=1 Tax=Pelistega europaea TaxID=106147 RepID=A0A7Y4P4I9_9BURK|nr:2Fe-2S iron-sulfur cluster binding domain-containing protein [Pelistega europaea]NOL50127.1 2Fe-2S iron-sulfur cluster binding domain-containing protein [Pelistega europaea]
MSERQLRWLAARVESVGSEQQLSLFLPSFVRFTPLPEHPVIHIKTPAGIACPYAIVSIDDKAQRIVVAALPQNKEVTSVTDGKACDSQTMLSSTTQGNAVSDVSTGNRPLVSDTSTGSRPSPRDVSDTTSQTWFQEGDILEVTAPFSQPQAHEDIDFYVTLARKGITLAIPKGVSISDVMREHHLHVNTSCEYGVCGTCYTTVLSGEIIHEDTYLMDDEKNQQDCMMICVSRGKPGTTIILDL